MTRNQKTYLVATFIFILYLAVIVGVAFLINFNGSRFAIFTVVLALVGLIATIVAVIYKIKNIDASLSPDASAIDTGNLDALVRSAQTRMKQARGAKSLTAMPLVYILGDENAGKTETVVQSGLDAELLAGQVHRDGLVAPTQLANIWYTSSAVIVEAGGPMLHQPSLWRRCITLTAPGKFGAAFKNAPPPPRAAVVCVATDRLLAGNSAESIRALGQALNEQLRLLSKTLGITLPVYILFTKLDSIPSFADYVANLSNDEVRNPLGSLLAQPKFGAGLYAESATTQIAQRFDELCYSLSEFRLEVLARGGEPDKLAKAYEFPRELRKLRAAIVDLLVETGRPSQLGVNPFLRGFYFTGLRARFVEENSTPATFTQPAPVPSPEGATRVFTFNTPPAAIPMPQSRPGTRRVPQWVFLPHLFNNIILADRGALDSSRASTRVHLVKRLLLAGLATCFLLFLIALTASYLNNRALESRLRAAATPTAPLTPNAIASPQDLQNLEQLRAVFTQIATYRKDGPPLFYSLGLYPGDKLYTTACAAYGNRFRALLLQPTQSLILARLAALPPTPKPSDDYSATYGPFRAYLITTANLVATVHPDKSALDVEPAVLLEAWTGDPNTRPIPAQSSELALKQFQTYSASLAEPNSCMASLGGPAPPSALAQTRAYLSHFQGIEQVYLSMKSAADRKNRSIRFNEDVRDSRPYVVDPYEVEGAFTKGGYAFMQNAILHPEPYTSGEPWVLGPQTGPTIDPATLNAQLPARYLADFLIVWRTFLKQAKVVTAADFPDAKNKLHQLDSPSSPLLQLFQIISQNTAVNNPPYSQPFQAPQFVVPPTAPSLPVGTPYIQSLQTLEGAINSMLLIPNSQNDPTASAPVIQAASAAEGAVGAIRGGFTPPDPAGQMDITSEALLVAPIKSVEALAKNSPTAAVNAGAKKACDATIDPILNKFPFNPDGKVDATLAEVASLFGPGQTIAQYAQQTKMVTQNGSMYLPTPGAPTNPTPAFLHFLTAAQTVAAAFLPPGGGPPTIAFTLTQQATPNLPPATLDIDGNTLSTAGQPKSFTWTSSPSSSIRLNAPAGNNIPAAGPWSLFHFAYSLKHPQPNRLEGVFEFNGKPTLSASGVPLDYKFDVSGPGAQFLNPGFMHNQLRCVTRVAQ